MTKHPLENDTASNEEGRAKHYAKIARETGAEGSHPAVKAVLKRPRDEDRKSDLVRVRQGATQEN